MEKRGRKKKIYTDDFLQSVLDQFETKTTEGLARQYGWSKSKTSRMIALARKQLSKSNTNGDDLNPGNSIMIRFLLDAYESIPADNRQADDMHSAIKRILGLYRNHPDWLAATEREVVKSIYKDRENHYAIPQ